MTPPAARAASRPGPTVLLETAVKLAEACLARAGAASRAGGWTCSSVTFAPDAAVEQGGKAVR